MDQEKKDYLAGEKMVDYNELIEKLRTFMDKKELELYEQYFLLKKAQDEIWNEIDEEEPIEDEVDEIDKDFEDEEPEEEEPIDLEEDEVEEEPEPEPKPKPKKKIPPKPKIAKKKILRRPKIQRPKIGVKKEPEIDEGDF